MNATLHWITFCLFRKWPTGTVHKSSPALLSLSWRFVKCCFNNQFWLWRVLTLVWETKQKMKKIVVIPLLWTCSNWSKCGTWSIVYGLNISMRKYHCLTYVGNRNSMLCDMFMCLYLHKHCTFVLEYSWNMTMAVKSGLLVCLLWVWKPIAGN